MPGVRVFDYSLKRFRTNPPEASADLKPHLEDTIPSFEDTDVLDDSDEPPIESYKSLLSFVKPIFQRYAQLSRSQTNSTTSSGSHLRSQPSVSNPHPIYLALARVAMSRVDRNQHLGQVLAAYRWFTTICVLMYRNEEKK